MFTLAALSQIAPSLGNSTQAWFDGLQKTFATFDISNDHRAAAFLAQTLYESEDFRALSEDLEYSAQGLLAVFPSYFDASQAQAYAYHPEMIANRVYANRLGNGDESSGDGWTYRGRGLIQLTGKTNYQMFANAVGMDISEVPAYLETPEGAAMSAGWYWQSNGLNALADADEFTEITIRINGGTNGLAQRKVIWNEALQALQAANNA